METGCKLRVPPLPVPSRAKVEIDHRRPNGGSEKGDPENIWLYIYIYIYMYTYIYIYIMISYIYIERERVLLSLHNNLYTIIIYYISTSITLKVAQK